MPCTHLILPQCDVTKRQMNENSPFCLHHRGSCLPACAKCTSRVVLVNTCAGCGAKAVERDLPVVYPMIAICG